MCCETSEVVTMRKHKFADVALAFQFYIQTAYVYVSGRLNLKLNQQV